MRRANHVTGFTLIEMLLALTLTAVLLTIVSVTIGSMFRDNHRLERVRSEPRWLEPAVEIIRQDLCEAESYQVKDGVITLHGHVGKQPQAQSPTPLNLFSHDPVTIEYRVLNLDESQWLVRQVTPGESVTTNESRPYELLCGGIQGLHLAVWVSDETPRPDAERPAPMGNDRNEPEMLPIPNQLLLTVTLSPPKNNERVKPAASVYDHAAMQPQTLERLIVIR